MASRLILDSNAFDMAQVLSRAYLENVVLPQIRDRAKRIVPVDTGELRDSIHVSVEGGFFVVADAPHAAFVELGTSKMRAQPYLRPAATSAITQSGG